MLKQCLESGAGRPTAGYAAVAMLTRDSRQPDTAWWPAHLAQEPAFLVYSITKTLIAAVLMQMVDERRIDLDDQLARWFPSMPQARRITLRQVLNHSAGLSDYGGHPAYQEALRRDPQVSWSFDRFLQTTVARSLLFDPGQGWAYSNPGYALLRVIAEQVGQAPLHDLVAARIVRPLGLSRTSVARTIGDLSSLAPAYSNALSENGNPRDVRTCYDPGWVSHGVAISTPSEIVRIFDALFRGEMISADALEAMTTFVAVPIPAPTVPPAVSDALCVTAPGYGLGLMGDAASRWGRLWGHNGGGPGYQSSAFFAPDRGGCVVCAMVTERAGERARYPESPESIVAAVLDGMG